MTVPVRGDATRQEIFWQNLLDFGSSEGCEQPAISVQEDYILPADVGSRFPELQSATENVNIGLTLMRESVSTFSGACQSDDPTEAATIGLQRAQLAITAFNDAQALLDTLRP
jgi:hypothetical protein